VRLWENDQGSLLGFTWSNSHEITLHPYSARKDIGSFSCVSNRKSICMVYT
jgi:hypothetical protein